jgi:hypothetical protein
MNRAGRALAAVVFALAVWCSFGTLAAENTTRGLERLGILPPLWVLPLLLVASLFAVRVLARHGLLAPFLFLPLICLPWLPGPVPAAFLSWTGPLVWAVWGAILLAVVWSVAPRAAALVGAAAGEPVRGAIAAGMITVALGGLGFHATRGWLPRGDEPHYLIITQSLLYDGDLRIENNHARVDYAAYFPVELRPDYLRRGTDGEIYSVHAPGLPALVLPAFAVGGYPAVVVFLILVSGLGSAVSWWTVWLLTRRTGAAWVGWAAVAWSSTFVFHTFKVFPDGVAAVGVSIGVWALLVPLAGSPWRWTAFGAVLAWLPWLHTRYSVLAGVLGLTIGARLLRSERPSRNLMALLAVPIASAAGWFASFWAIYGTLDPRAPYGGYIQSSVAYIPKGLVGLLFDQEFGLVAYAPSFLVALAGLAVLIAAPSRVVPPPERARWRAVGIALLVVVVPYVLLAAAYRMWWGGASAPARFLAPVTLALAVPAGAWWVALRHPSSRLFALASVAVSGVVLLALITGDRGYLAFNPPDGYALLLDWAFRTADVAHAMPSVFRHVPATVFTLVLVWVGALVAAWLVLVGLARGVVRSRPLTAACGLWLLAAAVMSAQTAAWQITGETRLRTGVPQLDLLGAAAAERAEGLSVRYSPVGAGGWPRLVTRPALLARLSITNIERPRDGQPRERFVLSRVPAGRYEIVVPPTSSEGTLTLAIGRGRPILGWELDPTDGGHERRFPFTLPVGVQSLTIRPDGLDPHAFDALRLVPLAFGGGYAGDQRAARRADRYGETVVYFTSGGVHPEPTGFWVAPRSDVELILFGERHAHPVGVQNGIAANHVTIESAGWSQTVLLAPNQHVDILVPAARRGRPTPLRVRARAGFVPSEHDAQSRDHRRLGVWIAPR